MNNSGHGKPENSEAIHSLPVESPALGRALSRFGGQRRQRFESHRRILLPRLSDFG
jgi:hypothetical protein